MEIEKKSKKRVIVEGINRKLNFEACNPKHNEKENSKRKSGEQNRLRNLEEESEYVKEKKEKIREEIRAKKSEKGLETLRIGNLCKKLVAQEETNRKLQD